MIAEIQDGPQRSPFPATHTFVLSPPPLDQGQSVRPTEHGRSNSKSFLGLGYKRHTVASMCASPSLSLSVSHHYPHGLVWDFSTAILEARK